MAPPMSADRAAAVCMSCKNLTEIPEEILKRNDIRSLDLSRNSGIRLSGLKNAPLGNVKTLMLEQCDLFKMPDDICELTELVELYLSFNRFSDGFNPKLEHLKQLKKLFLRRCNLSALPESLGALVHLEELDLSSNQLPENPDVAFNRLLGLKKLDLSECGLVTFPESLGNLERLEELDMSRNRFSEGLSPTIGKLHRLKKLDLWECELRTVPDELGDLLLEELYLPKNWFSMGLNPAIGRLCRLRKLDLGECTLQTLPDSLEELKLIEELYLSKNFFSMGVNPAVGRLRRLRKLDLGACELRSVPESFAELQQLEELDLSRNRFSEGLNPVNLNPLGRLVKLRTLDLRRCKLPAISDWLGELKLLEELYLSDNPLLGGLNPAIGLLHRLAVLDISNCELQEVPDWLGDLQMLEILCLRNNRLKEYPLCTLRVNAMHELDISNDVDVQVFRQSNTTGNRITDLPVALAFTRLKRLQLDRNPITEPPEDIWTQGLDALKFYMRALLPGGELMRADTINMLGDTGAGKTSIAQSLVALSPSPTASCDRTRVMQQFQMRIDESSGQSVIINDFGGHEYYHSIMPIFLPANGLLVLAFDMSDPNQKQSVEKWLRTALAVCGEIRIIIAGTHADLLDVQERVAVEEQITESSLKILKSAVNEVQMHIDSIESRQDRNLMENKLKKLKELQHNLTSAVVRFVTLSCTVPDHGLESLRQLVVDQLRAPENLPARWFRAIKELLTGNAEHIFITTLEFENICKKHFRDEDDDSAITTILRYLARTSQIIWIEDHPHLQSYIFHLPQKIVDACKNILYHDNNALNSFPLITKVVQDYNNGVMREPLLRALLHSYEDNLYGSLEAASLDGPTFSVVVNFLQQFNLIINIKNKTNGHQYIIPCKLSSSEPPIFKEYTQRGEHNENRVSVRLSFMGSMVPLSFFETSLALMRTVTGGFANSYVCSRRSGLIVVNDAVYFLATLDGGDIVLTAFSESTAVSPWTLLQPMLSRLNDNIIASWHGAPPRCTIPCLWCSRHSSQGKACGESAEAQIGVDLSTLTSPKQENNTRPTCSKCMNAIPLSLCSPNASRGSL